MLNDTISAISTPHGKGGVAIIRISGDNALEIAKRVFSHKGDEVKPRYAYYGEILRGDEIIDDGILTYFKAPNSFTGEDVCEICCHGGLYVTRAVLEATLTAGARMASAGEFTRRAFINGRLSLSRAEAIGQVIDAKTDTQMRLSASNARGTLSKRIDEIREKILALLSHAYATIDYPDEDISDLERQDMSSCLDFVISSLATLKKSYHTGKAVSEGVKTAIIGKPNAGKSSVYNMLLGEEVAIVTDIAGTTRDIIEHTASVGGVTLNLADTAGIRESLDMVEKIGIERAKAKIEDSELLLCVFDSSAKETDEDEFILECARGRISIALINKNDRESRISDKFERKIKEVFKHVLYISAKNSEGVLELGDIIAKLYELDELNLSSDAIVASARVFSSVSVALERAIEAKEALDMGETPDIICFSLENALSELDMIDGRMTSEEIVNTIFSRFCVGK